MRNSLKPGLKGHICAQDHLYSSSKDLCDTHLPAGWDRWKISQYVRFFA